MASLIVEADDNSSLISTYEHFDPIDEDHTNINADKKQLIRNDSEDSHKQWPHSSGVSGRKTSPTEHKYEDFASKLTLQCPTCKGKGKLTQSMSAFSLHLLSVNN